MRFLANELMLVAPTNRRPAVFPSFVSPSHRTRASDSTGILSWAVDNNLMSVFLKIETDLQIFVRTTNIRYLQNSSTGSVVERCGQTQYSPYDAIRFIYAAQRARRLTLVPPFPVQYGGICDVPLPKT